ncbi:MAG: hypothetical protein PHV33_05285 [Elusimicrobiales bacterium]|nr:hypothetical protein [Elusimicrobiales bacterium]
MKQPPAFARFSPGRLAVLRRLDSPRKVQDFLDYSLAYNDAKPDTCLSPLEVLKQRKAHCIEGAMLAAAAFLLHGRRPLLLDLRANPRDDDHVIAPFVENGRWGAVAQSHFCGLRYREPVHESFGELARSYFEFYYNHRGEKTLREYSEPLDAASLKPDWLWSEKNVFFVSRRLDAQRHHRIIGHAGEKNLRKADSLLLAGELLGGSRVPLARRRPLPYARLKLPRVRP